MYFPSRRLADDVSPGSYDLALLCAANPLGGLHCQYPYTPEGMVKPLSARIMMANPDKSRNRWPRSLLNGRVPVGVVDLTDRVDAVVRAGSSPVLLGPIGLT
jgi:hypothetical protein